MNYKKNLLFSFKVENCLLNITKKVKHQFFFNEEDFRYIKTRHSFHLVDPSPWPLTSSLGAFMLTTGGVLYMHKFIGGDRLLLTGLFVILYSMYTWWRDVIREATFEDQHTFAVQRGLRLGMILCALLRLLFCCEIRQSHPHSYSTLCGSSPRVAVTVMCCGKALGDGGVRLSIICQDSSKRC